MSQQYDEGVKVNEYDPSIDSFTYQILIVKLLYLTMNWSNITYGVQNLSQLS